jgi:hypothetical protein
MSSTSSSKALFLPRSIAIDGPSPAHCVMKAIRSQMILNWASDSYTMGQTTSQFLWSALTFFKTHSCFSRDLEAIWSISYLLRDQSPNSIGTCFLVRLHSWRESLKEFWIAQQDGSQVFILRLFRHCSQVKPRRFIRIRGNDLAASWCYRGKDRKNEISSRLLVINLDQFWLSNFVLGSGGPKAIPDEWINPNRMITAKWFSFAQPFSYPNESGCSASEEINELSAGPSVARESHPEERLWTLPTPIHFIST